MLAYFPQLTVKLAFAVCIFVGDRAPQLGLH